MWNFGGKSKIKKVILQLYLNKSLISGVFSKKWYIQI